MDLSRITINNASLDDIYDAHCLIPELAASANIGRYQQRVEGWPWLGLVATEGNRLVGFKLGYELNPLTFYSWLGGVLPDYRGNGVAQALLDAQEQWAYAQGYQIIEVKTLPAFVGMQALLARNRYELLQYQQDSEQSETKLLYRKRLLLE